MSNEIILADPELRPVYGFPELRVKIKSLAAEQSMIRLEENRQKAHRRGDWLTVYRSLHDHRLGLRKKIRSALLAYQFLRGRPFPEYPWGSEPDWSSVKANVERFAFRAYPTAQDRLWLMSRLADWMKSAQDARKAWHSRQQTVVTESDAELARP